MSHEDNDTDREEREIDLVKLGLQLWDSRLTILKWISIATVMGLIIAFSIPKEYTATVKLVPEVGDNRARSNLNSLAAMAGINLGTATSNNDAVNPMLYPDIVNSTPFSAGLLNVNILTDNAKTPKATLEYILSEDTSKPWWSYILIFPMKLFGGGKKTSSVNENINKAEYNQENFRLTNEEARMIETVRKRVNADIDSKTNVVTLNVTLQDPVAAANLADTVADRLQKYITDYRTSKARNDLDYARMINEEAKTKYFEAQKQYASYVDKNQGLANRSAAIELDRLQNEVTLAFNLYNSTAQQVQLAEAKVQSTTPVFAVIEPSSVPIRPSKPRKMFILAGIVFLAFLTASVYILFYDEFKNIVKIKRADMKKESLRNESA